jgi:SAM-dependent methyltransferase
MGKNGKPGASLRAFANFDSRINVTGADIDHKILFSAERINCFYIDQNNLQTYFRISDSSGIEKFDLIIDDGLHSTFANINSLIFARKHLRPGGHLIIEDIPDRAMPVWNLVIGLMRELGHELITTRATKCHVLIFKQKI